MLHADDEHIESIYRTESTERLSKSGAAERMVYNEASALELAIF